MPEFQSFPKPVPRLAPVPGDDNFEAQLLAALDRIHASVGEVQNTLTLLLAVLTMDEEETTGNPQ